MAFSVKARKEREMSGIWGSLIPGTHKEFATSSDQYLEADAPVGGKYVVGIRINDVTSGGSLTLRMGGNEVTYDFCSVGEVLVGRYDKIESTASSVDSVIVYYS